MNWSLRNNFTSTQATETARFLLSLAHTAFIGSTGYLFVATEKGLVRVIIFILGVILGVIFYLFAMRLLREVKNHNK